MHFPVIYIIRIVLLHHVVFRYPSLFGHRQILGEAPRYLHTIASFWRSKVGVARGVAYPFGYTVEAFFFLPVIPPLL